MVSAPAAVPLRHVKEELKRLRQGQGLAHPAAVLGLSPQLRSLISGAPGSNAADDVVRLVTTIRRAIDSLGEHERIYARADFNLAPGHSYPTLTARQESLAAELKCAGKTVRRHADKALDTLAGFGHHATRPGGGSSRRTRGDRLRRRAHHLAGWAALA